MEKVAHGIRISLYFEIYNGIARFPCDSTAFLFQFFMTLSVAMLSNTKITRNYHTITLPSKFGSAELIERSECAFRRLPCQAGICL